MSCAHSVHYLIATPPIKGLRVQIGPNQLCICVGRKQRYICVILNQIFVSCSGQRDSCFCCFVLQSQHPVAKTRSGGLLYQLRSNFHSFRDDYEFLIEQDWTHSQSPPLTTISPTLCTHNHPFTVDVVPVHRNS